MPLTIPTPREIRNMNVKQRADMRRRLLPVLADLRDSLAEFDRHNAHAWAAEYGEDPDAAEHVRVLMEAIA